MRGRIPLGISDYSLTTNNPGCNTDSHGDFLSYFFVRRNNKGYNEEKVRHESVENEKGYPPGAQFSMGCDP